MAHADRSSCLTSCSDRYLQCRSSQSDTQCNHPRIFCETNCPDTRQNNYGAIAYDIGTGAWGWSGDFPSQQAADRHALQKCATRSPKCTVVVRFVNGSGALAAGQGSVWVWERLPQDKLPSASRSASATSAARAAAYGCEHVRHVSRI
jgi:hypothetical protein